MEINSPKECGVNLSIKRVVLGLFPSNTLNGAIFSTVAASPVISSKTSSFVFPLHKASACP